MRKSGDTILNYSPFVVESLFLSFRIRPLQGHIDPGCFSKFIRIIFCGYRLIATLLTPITWGSKNSIWRCKEKKENYRINRKGFYTDQYKPSWLSRKSPGVLYRS